MNNQERRSNGEPVEGRSRTIDSVHKGLAARYSAERRFRVYGLAAIIMSLVCLSIVFVSIFSKGYTAFVQTYVQLDIYFDPTKVDKGKPAEGDYQGMVKSALRKMFPDVQSRAAAKRLNSLISPGAAFQLRRMVQDDPSLVGKTAPVWVPADDDLDMLMKGHMDRTVQGGRLKDDQFIWIDQLAADGKIEKRFNWVFFESGDSREPELAGIRSALMGSLLTLVVTLGLSFPIGVAAAVYLEEFASRNRFTDLIEVNINNLAAVPSIIYGLLGLAVFINFFYFPRSAPVVGGLVLSLMTLPIIIIASRASLKSVPPSIREAALGIGASHMQATLHHVLPLALPGILTGAIIGMAHALGETAPLLMIGMVAFIVDTPTGFTDPATVLPVQIYLWADSPERGFVEKTSAAIMVLLAFLVVMNATAVFLRRKFERRW